MSRRPRVDYLEIPRRRRRRDPMFVFAAGILAGYVIGRALALLPFWPW